MDDQDKNVLLDDHTAADDLAARFFARLVERMRADHKSSRTDRKLGVGCLVAAALVIGALAYGVCSFTSRTM